MESESEISIENGAGARTWLTTPFIDIRDERIHYVHIKANPEAKQIFNMVKTLIQVEYKQADIISAEIVKWVLERRPRRIAYLHRERTTGPGTNINLTLPAIFSRRITMPGYGQFHEGLAETIDFHMVQPLHISLALLISINLHASSSVSGA
ncbi:hypothetical protein EVAR_6847_1 [Eumeta japonica]|uniref:Uncharacterized protein n=1 Tax=Eumeta variegata TaxID=151549 RepID=A0A4C1U694_EUMVA|nr:hypothetical protein EVAR_6847_1 [Eumeta japonica]